MKIQGKRIRNIEKYLGDIEEGATFRIALLQPNDFENRVIRAGFNDLESGIQILPNVVGPRSRFNAEGGFIVHRDREKETRFRELVITDWHGNPHTVDIAYLRYPRTSIPPPSIELTVMENDRRELLIISPDLVNERANYTDILHVANLFLELFGECDTVGDNNRVILNLNVPVRRLNWTVLPVGQYPWERVRASIDTLVDRVRENYQPIIRQRFETISSYHPNFMAIGRAGFNGYVVFGFPDRDFFVLESIYHNNATYILGNDWEELSQLTKADLIAEELYIQRFEHRVNWPEEVRNLFG
ncbi:hypothetical protein FAZ19_09950 [Sphingobacterium alkalisoli]|uniref:Uncharacterized protein n=1 Tax=Sphingobacterium alkalisoli TaxID=1874115 RepID=A0A4U0H1J1_9SPHI|nr:hypothetical protein [Sphingobacterium alkalisoli]TJY65457.1 hypothetical protein FAZ19_09950 [Sphingobacterium alkalisoli]